MYAGSGDEHSGAGSFANSGGVANDNGHDLGLNTSSPPFSSMTNVTLTCASCHDPHGTPNYRNVLTAPAGGTGIGLANAAWIVEGHGGTIAATNRREGGARFEVRMPRRPER
jgi:hypothetical protein